MPTVSAIVCTKNSIASIESCLISLREANIDQLIVVDAHSTDGTTEIARDIADSVLTDEGEGLGAARNTGIAQTTGDFILNFGSDNVLPAGQLEIMRSELERGNFAGVSAQTKIQGSGYLTFGLNAWREGRFQPGQAKIIGTPTLFRGDQLRTNPYDQTRKFSDDSELCERWTREFNATFAISHAWVWEVGKATPREIIVRARMYGVSDYEVFSRGLEQGWPSGRRARSVLHPIRSDLIEPVVNLPTSKSLLAVPFFVAFACARYVGWLEAIANGHSQDSDAASIRRRSSTDSH